MSEPLNMPPIVHYRLPPTARQLCEVAHPLAADPLAAGRRIHLRDPADGYLVGSSESSARVLSIEAFPWVELSVIEAGELQVQGEGFNLLLRAGDCLVVPRGAALRWQENGAVRRLFMAFPGFDLDATTPRQPLKLDLAAALPVGNPPAASVLLTEAPKAWSETLFTAGKLRIGVWECEAYARRQVEPAYSELMFILQGVVTLSAQTGEQYQVRKGETVVVPRGATNAWSSTETVRKVFCIVS